MPADQPDTLEQHWAAFDKRAEELGHKLRRDDDGDIDHFVHDFGFHNGPGCELCHEDWCHHCSGPEDIEPCDGGKAHHAFVEALDRSEFERLSEKYGAEKTA